MHCFSCQVSFCSSLSISPLQALGLFCCIGSGIDFHRLEVIAQDVLIARDVPALIVPQPSSGLVVVGRLGRGIVPVDVFHHISLLHMKRLVGDGVHGLLGSPAFQHRPGKHDLPGSSAVVAQPVLVERLDRDLCPVRHPQHGKLIGGQLLCQFGLAVQRRRFPGILRKAGQEFLFVKLRRCFRLRLQGCRCGQIHPAAPYAPARRNCQQERRQQHAEPAAVLPDAVLPAQDVKIAVPAAAAFPAELPDTPHLILGGGTGFLSKTVGYPYLKDDYAAALFKSHCSCSMHPCRRSYRVGPMS